jgi:hypothetical protein
VAQSISESFRVDIDLDHAREEADRISQMLGALRRRHDLSRYEYTKFIRIRPAGETFAHPVLTLGNRFADSEDLLLSTYLHEQMHWYLWHLGTPDRDMVAPFYDELVRRYPDAPIELPDGARNYDATYTHLVVNWLEIAATSEFIGRARAFAVATAQRSYRWIYRTVVNDWDALGDLYERHGIVPLRSASELMEDNANAVNGGRQRTAVTNRRHAAPRSRRKSPGRDGRKAG